MSRAFDLLLSPLAGRPTAALWIVSLAAGVVLLAIVRALSPQVRLRALRRRFQARLLEIRIYQHDPVLILRAFAGALAANLGTMRLMLVPAVAAGAVAAIAYFQLESRFARAPLQPGETAVVTATFAPDVDVVGDAPSLTASAGASAELAVRVPARREVSWRVRATGRGAPRLTLGVDGRAFAFPLAAAPGTRAVGEGRSRSAWDLLVRPGLPALGDLPIERVEVRYRPAVHALGAWRVSWLGVFVLGSLAGALALRLLLPLRP